MAYCDSCGNSGFETECKKCGYKKVLTRTLDPIAIIFCEDCGVHYSVCCEKGHPLDHQKKVEFNVVPKGKIT